MGDQNERTMGGSKRKEQWEDQKKRKNNGGSKGMNRAMDQGTKRNNGRNEKEQTDQ